MQAKSLSSMGNTAIEFLTTTKRGFAFMVIVVILIATTIIVFSVTCISYGYSVHYDASGFHLITKKELNEDNTSGIKNIGLAQLEKNLSEQDNQGKNKQLNIISIKNIVAIDSNLSTSDNTSKSDVIPIKAPINSPRESFSFDSNKVQNSIDELKRIVENNNNQAIKYENLGGDTVERLAYLLDILNYPCKQDNLKVCTYHALLEFQKSHFINKYRGQVGSFTIQKIIDDIYK